MAAALPAPTAAARARSNANAALVRARLDREVPQPDGPANVDWLSRCVSDVMDEGIIALSELGIVPGPMRLGGQNRLFSNVHAGRLGWAFPAALGAQLADRELVVAAMGVGSYIFANPPACHQIAEAQSLPVLTVIRNDGMWNAVRRSVVASYPNGAAARANRMPLTSLVPQPGFGGIARASRTHAERVEDAADLPMALARAVDVIRTERRQALLGARVAVSESQ